MDGEYLLILPSFYIFIHRTGLIQYRFLQNIRIGQMMFHRLVKNKENECWFGYKLIFKRISIQVILNFCTTYIKH